MRHVLTASSVIALAASAIFFVALPAAATENVGHGENHSAHGGGHNGHVARPSPQPVAPVPDPVPAPLPDPPAASVPTPSPAPAPATSPAPVPSSDPPAASGSTSGVASAPTRTGAGEPAASSGSGDTNGAPTGNPTAPASGDPSAAPTPDAQDPVATASATSAKPQTLAERAEPEYSPPHPKNDHDERSNVSYHFSPGAVSTTGSFGRGSTGIDLYSVSAHGVRLADTCSFAPSAATCSFTGLTPGTWELKPHRGSDEARSRLADGAYFIVPLAPTVTAKTKDDGRVVFSGHGFPGDRVLVQNGGGDTVCTAVASYFGSWSCSIDAPGVGDHTFTAVQVNTWADGAGRTDCATFIRGGTSPRGSPVTVHIAPPPPVVTPTVALGFAPGAVTVHATPTPGSSRVQISLYPAGGTAGSEATDGCPYQVGEVSCTFDGLAAGAWKVVAVEDNGDGVTPSTASEVDGFVVPPTPTMDAAVNGHFVTFTGSSVAGDRIQVVDSEGDIVCSAVEKGDGSWSCTSAALAVGAHSFRAFQQDEVAASALPAGVPAIVGGLSAVSAPVAVTVAAPIVHTARTIDPGWTFGIIGVDLAHIHAGDHFTITGHGLPAGLTIAVELHSIPAFLGSAAVAADGSFTLDAAVPEDTPTGLHHVVVTVSGDGFEPSTKVVPVTVVPVDVPASVAAASQVVPFVPTVPPSVETQPAPTADKPAAAPAETASPTIAPNILTRALGTIGDVLSHPGKVGSALAIGLVLIIFATLPAHLLNATIAEQYERFVRRIPKPKKAPHWFAAMVAWFVREPAVGALSIIVVTALLFGFADPNFGFTLASLRLFLACAIALFFVGFLANTATRVVMKRQWNVDVRISVRPLGLVMTVVGVVLSRFLHFSPGFLVGLILGLSIANKAAQSEAWKAVLIRSLLVLGMGLGAWVAYSALASEPLREETFGSALLSETLVAITTEGLVALVVVLLPFRFLEGERLYQRSRALWAGVYLVSIVSFFVAVVSWDGNWQVLGNSFWLWLVVVVGFGALCVGVYLYFRVWAKPLYVEDIEDADEEVPLGEDR